MKVEEYVPGQHMKLAYWWPVGSPQLLPAFLLNQNISEYSVLVQCSCSLLQQLIASLALCCPVSSCSRLIVAMDPSNAKKPFVVSHIPPLSALEGVGIDQGKMSVEELLERCVAVRSRSLLQEMVESLKGSQWEDRGRWKEKPPSCSDNH